jgi:PAS domain S-box-containing protein
VLDGSAESFEMEYDSSGPSGSRCFLMLVSPFKGEGGGAVVSHTDITERRRTEEALHESEKRFHLMAETAPVMVWMSGFEMGRTYFNKRWLEFTGRTLEEETGTGWTEGLHPDDARKYLDRYAEAFDAREEFRVECRLRRSDGEYRWLLDSGTPRLDREGRFNGYIGSCIDITEEKLTRESLRNLSAHLIAAHEEERHRIAMELHDDLNQKVALLAVDLELLGQRPPESPEAFRRQLGELAERIREISSDVHDLSHKLHPAKLEQLGLAATVRGFCREVLKKDGVRIHFVQRGVPRSIPKDRAVCIYRIVQEALRNVVKHSGATEAKVELIGDKGAIELRVSDPGVGFDPESLRKKGGIGLLNMRERIRLVGGEISFKSRPGQGTHVEARVPLPTPEPGANDIPHSAPRDPRATRGEGGRRRNR